MSTTTSSYYTQWDGLDDSLTAGAEAEGRAIGAARRIYNILADAREAGWKARFRERMCGFHVIWLAPDGRQIICDNEPNKQAALASACELLAPELGKS